MKLTFKIRRLLGYRLMKVIGRLLALFIPSSPARKRFRNWFVDPARVRWANTMHLRELRKIAGVRVEQVHEATTLTWNGLRFKITDEDRTASCVILELLRGEYHFAMQARTCVVMDIGMNCGFASMYFASRDDVQAVYAFEPVPATYQSALSNFQMNPQCADKIRAFNCGLGDGAKEVRINFIESASGRTTTFENPNESVAARTRHKGGVNLTVQIKDAAAEIGNIIQQHPGTTIVVKCDCEGAEKEIFERLDANDLLSCIDVVVMEFHLSFDKLISPLLDKNGFAYFVNRGGGDGCGMIRAVKTTSKSA